MCACWGSFRFLAGGVELCHGLLMIAWGLGLPLLVWRRHPRLSSYYIRFSFPAALDALPSSWFEHALRNAAWLAAFDLEDASPLRWVRQSRARQLLIHGTADSQVPLRHSLALSSLAGPLVELRRIPGAEHYDLPQGLLESEGLAWFERWLMGSSCRR